MEHALITARSVWTSRDLSDMSAWSVVMSEADAREAEALVAELEAVGKSLNDVTREDFRWELCEQLSVGLREELFGGRGFVLLRGIPVERLGPRGTATFFWGLGNLLGTPLPQNLLGERLYEVQDERTRGGLVLSSKTNVALPWHTDSGSGAFANAVPDVLGLLTLRTSRSGGMSYVISAHTVYNELLRRYPTQLHRLFEDFYFDRSLQTQPGQEPFTRTSVFEHVDGTVGIRYNRQRIERGYHLAGMEMTVADEEALDCLDEVLVEPDLSLCFGMAPGDALLANNRITLHNRSEFVDGDTPDKKRLLYRLWIQRKQ